MRIVSLVLSGWIAAGTMAAAAADPAATAPAAPASARAGGQIRGSISYGRNNPAPGVVVIIRPDGTGTHVYAATTGESGTFAFDGVADGAYRAEARREGYKPVVKSGIVVRAPFRAVVELLLTKGEAAVEPPPRLEGTAALRGRIRVHGGAPVGEVRVRLTRADAGADPRSTLTDSAGAFDFATLDAGRWRLEALGAGLLPLRADLDLTGAFTIDLALARQPANYRPLAQDLIVPEDVIPPKQP